MNHPPMVHGAMIPQRRPPANPYQHPYYHPRLQEPKIGFGGGFTAGQLASTGLISYAIVRLLGASVPGAIAMGIGNILWEAGSPGIPAGWKRYVLGLFRKPE